MQAKALVSQVMTLLSTMTDGEDALRVVVTRHSADGLEVYPGQVSVRELLDAVAQDQPFEITRPDDSVRVRIHLSMEDDDGYLPTEDGARYELTEKGRRALEAEAPGPDDVGGGDPALEVASHDSGEGG